MAPLASSCALVARRHIDRGEPASAYAWGVKIVHSRCQSACPPPAAVVHAAIWRGALGEVASEALEADLGEEREVLAERREVLGVVRWLRLRPCVTQRDRARVLGPDTHEAARVEDAARGGGVPGIFVGVPLPDDRTRLIHTEESRGIAAPFVDLDTIEAGYEQVTRARGDRVESRQREAASVLVPNR